MGIVGGQYLPLYCECWGKPVWASIRFDLAPGYRFQAGRDAPFLSSKLAFGAVFARRVSVHGEFGSTPIAYTKHQFRSEIDLVFDLRFYQGGELVGFLGIELDPLRIVPDAAHLFTW